MSAMAAQAGKDIYCEKPSAVTSRRSQAMRAAVQRYGRVYQAGTQQRSEYGGKFRQACEFVRSGRIGKLQGDLCLSRWRGRFWPNRRLWPKRYNGQTRAGRAGLGPLSWPGAVDSLRRHSGRIALTLAS
jgi:predicted dehydrogenase